MKSVMVRELFSAEETERLGFELGKAAKCGEVYTLSGELGAGKTVFAKGFAKGLGVEEHVTSPTFTLINEYLSGRLPFYHFDIYRISDISELYDIGYEEYFYANGVCLVEWSERARELMPENAVGITIRKDISKGENYRIAEVGLK